MMDIIDTIELDRQEGFDLIAHIHCDYDHGAPWEKCDGHGPVSDWTCRDKLPGELILCEDRGSRRFYDFAAACRIARRDGWDAKPYNEGGESKAQQAAKAARADYEYLRRYCDGQWQYVGVSVKALRNGVKLGSASLWGIEDSERAYIEECAVQASSLAIEEAKAALAQLCQCEGSDK